MEKPATKKPKRCPDRTDGGPCVFSPDYEYDQANPPKPPPKPCSHCGARTPREEPIEVPAEQQIAAGDWKDAPIGIVTGPMLRAMAKASRVVVSQ